MKRATLLLAFSLTLCCIADFKCSQSPALKLKDGRPVNAGFFGQSSFADVGVCSISSLVKVDKDVPGEIACTFACGLIVER